MSDFTTVARPYAKAVFEHALQIKDLSRWSQCLQILAQAILEPATLEFIHNPASTVEQQVELLMTVIARVETKDQLEVVHRLLTLLAENKKLKVLPEVYAQYEALRREQEKTLTVEVRSASQLTKEKEQQLIKSLSQRLQREITLDLTVDETLLGGAVIRAGDLVIDGSVRGKLNKLKGYLAA